MSEYKIEKGVPIPESTGGRNTSGKGAKARYPWRDMEVGDSFYVTNGPGSASSYAMHTAAKYQGFKVAVRRDPKGFRVWRIA